MVASVLAAAPRTDHFLVGKADFSTRIHVGESTLISLHEGALNVRR